MDNKPRLLTQLEAAGETGSWIPVTRYEHHPGTDLYCFRFFAWRGRDRLDAIFDRSGLGRWTTRWLVLSRHSPGMSERQWHDGRFSTSHVPVTAPEALDLLRDVIAPDDCEGDVSRRQPFHS